MIINTVIILFDIFAIVFQLAYGADISYNLPNISSCAMWDINGITFARIFAPQLLPSALFVDRNNTVYVTGEKLSRLFEWRNSNSSLTKEFLSISFQPFGLFVLSTGDIYISGSQNGRIDKWIRTNATTETVLQFDQLCNDIFISINDMIYCSMTRNSIVATKPLYNSSKLMTVIAGVGVSGCEADMLSSPKGIFVTTNLDLYVAEETGNRIKLFHRGEINGIEIPDRSDTFKLYKPTSVVLDANNQIYILEQRNHRLVVKTHNGFRCLIGCAGMGHTSDRFHFPRALAFDSYGNIFVTDSYNVRVQKFLLLKNKCDSNENLEITTTLTSTTNTGIAVESLYDSILTASSPKYRANCDISLNHYEAVQMYVSKQGNYEFLINSTIKVNVYIYKHDFNPAYLHSKFILHHYIACDVCQIKFRIDFQSNRTYQLAIATQTFIRNPLASFSIISIGSSKIDFNRINIPMIETSYSLTLTNKSRKCSRDEIECGALNFYCEIIEIDVLETGYYTIMSNNIMNVYGQVYEKNLTFFDLSMNEIQTDGIQHCAIRFPISLLRQKNTSFVLLVTTQEPHELGKFLLTINGPTHVQIKHIENDNTPIIESNYSSQLSNTSQKYDHLNCHRLDYYYQALSINVTTSDYYMFLSKSVFKTDAYLFEHDFKPYNSQETFLVKDGFSCDENGFRLITYLKSNMRYVLLVTTSLDKPNVKGPFSVLAKGPSRILMKQINDISIIVQSRYYIELNKHSRSYGLENCHDQNYFYESIQINVVQSGNYALTGSSGEKLSGHLYVKHFDSHNPSERLYLQNQGDCSEKKFKIIAYLQSNISYILIMSRHRSLMLTGHIDIEILVSGVNNVTLNRIHLQRIYSSELTKENQVYPRVCHKGKYHYETIEINVKQNGSYIFDGNSTILLYGYLYENNFDPSYPQQNLITQSHFSCGNHFQLGSYLQTNINYILVVTTFDPNVRGAFTLSINGSNNVTLNRIVKQHNKCVVGDQCNLYAKSIGLTINDILRNQIQPNISFRKQSSLIHTATAISMIMFLIGFISSIFSFVTFKDKELRKVGCAIYLLASSITSLLTISMFTLQFWFVVFIELNSTVNSSALLFDCIFIGPVLKLCLYFDGWLNACVAFERTINVSKGVTFNKKLSQTMARRLVLILPILIMGSIIHEPMHHQLFKHTTQRYELIENTRNISNASTREDSFKLIDEQHVLCVIRYSTSWQIYNTITLYFHLLVPFVVNLFSALFIIFGTARQRSTTRRNHTLKQHIFKQINEHKQLLISPFILLILAMPRLILSLVSGCVDPTDNPWLYLCAYFISYIPPMLIFVVFVLPSKLYTKTFKDTIAICRQ